VGDARLRIGVIGCGKVSQNVHLPALTKSTHCRLGAVCDTSPEVAAAIGLRYPGTSVYDSVDALLSDHDVDAVIVAVGDPEHVEVALRAIDAGKHVLVEKPLATSVSECVPLRDSVRASGLKLQVGLMKRHDAGFEYARRAVQERIGPVISFSAWYRASADELVDEASLFLPVMREPGWRRPAYKLDRKRYRLATHGAHLFDSIRWLLGDPTNAHAAHASRGENDSWHGLLELETGAIGHFELTVYIQSEWNEGFDVFGQEGTVHVRGANPFFLRPARARLFLAHDRETTEPLFPAGDPYLRQLDAFARSIANDEPTTPNVDDGIAALELIEAVERSVEVNSANALIAHA
jgi:predicted dehydrogenase